NFNFFALPGLAYLHCHDNLLAWQGKAFLFLFINLFLCLFRKDAAKVLLNFVVHPYSFIKDSVP
ncbi:MAG: hypothetical protein IJS92_00590, partial [Paludibacteraceae bacterium]|nr:hypothetical protein [Paludibacteraceae bacterium]